jgi:hypothetical protein
MRVPVRDSCNDDPSTILLPSAEYYRRHAALVRQLASEATAAAVKEHLPGGCIPNTSGLQPHGSILARRPTLKLSRWHP